MSGSNGKPLSFRIVEPSYARANYRNHDNGMKLYVAGPMRGYPRLNFDNFVRMSNNIWCTGHTAINPAELDILCGMCIDTVKEEDITDDIVRSMLLRDIVLIMTEADGLVVLDGWEASAGARMEFQLARALKLPVYNELGELIA